MKVSIAVEMTMTLVCLPDCACDCGPFGDDDSAGADGTDVAGLLIDSADKPLRFEVVAVAKRKDRALMKSS
jgi:hypothetical protein